MAKSANTSLLYLSKKEGGLDLPSLSSLYKRLQVSRQCQLLTSEDPCVRRIAEDDLQVEISSRRVKFRPGVDTIENKEDVNGSCETKCGQGRAESQKDRVVPRQGDLF